MKNTYLLKHFILHLCLILCCVSSTHAQGLPAADTNRYELNEAFNNVYRQNAPTLFFGNEYGGPEKYLLVADINPNIVVFGTKKSRFFFLFSPRVYLRLFSAYKSPVRSPSYMPGGTLDTRLNNDPAAPKFMSLSYTHHSNGQEGPTLDVAGNFNTVEGKFTTNFYKLDYYWGKKNTGNTRATSEFGSIGIELHTGLLKTGYSKELTDKYGFIRTNGSWFYDIANDKKGNNDRFHDRQRVRVDFSYILDDVENRNIVDVSKRLNASLKYFHQFSFMENVAFTATAGYRGQDPYNIFFQDSYAYFTIGIASGISFNMKKK